MSWNRDKFEDELFLLQSDLHHLSQKLNSSSTPEYKQTGNRRASSVQKLVNGQQVKIGRKPLAKQDSDLVKVIQERDDALARLDHAHEELERMRQITKESAKLSILYDHLKQDFESLQTSFHSSEKIRKQQKELIQLLTKNNQDSSIEYPATIEMTANVKKLKNGNRTDGATVVSLSSNHLSPSVNDENQSWLNSFSKESVSGFLNKSKRMNKHALKNDSPRSVNTFKQSYLAQFLSTPSQNTRSHTPPIHTSSSLTARSTTNDNKQNTRQTPNTHKDLSRYIPSSISSNKRNNRLLRSPRTTSSSSSSSTAVGIVRSDVQRSVYSTPRSSKNSTVPTKPHQHHTVLFRAHSSDTSRILNGISASTILDPKSSVTAMSGRHRERYH